MKPNALVSVIICTIRRPELYSGLIASLERQTWRNVEVLVVGRQGESAPAFNSKSVRWMSAPKGLAPARNVGLANASGDVVIFFDDDVAIPDDFIAQAMQILSQPEHVDVGGLTGYDTQGFGTTPNLRWKLRKHLGITPSLRPGDSNHLGRSVTLAFFHPFTGCRDVKWLPGYCQIFRREAVEGLKYDETIIVEDRDFSMRVGDNWRLIASGDLKLQHLMDGEARHTQAFQTWRAAFGLGRIYAKRRRGIADRFAALHVAAGELLIDSLVFLREPRLNNIDVAWMRLKGFCQGYTSLSKAEPPRPPQTNRPQRLLLAGTFLSGHVGTRAPIEDLAERLEARGYEVIRTSPIRNGLARGLDVLATTLRNRGRIDVAVVDLYSGRAFLWGEALGMLLQSMRIPFIYSMHGGALPEFAEQQPARVRQCLARATAVTAPSRYLGERMKPYLTSTHSIPNPLELAHYPFRLRQNAQPNIVWVRRLHNIYNPALAPQVVALLADQWPNVTLTMVGRDENDGSAAETKRIAADLGVTDRIRFTGGVPRSEVAAHLNAADIFLNTSNIDNTPVSVMEAMACGLCVVSTDPGGVPYLVRNGGNGLLAACGDARGLAHHIDSLLREPALARSLSTGGRQTVQAFDWPVVLPAWEQLLQSAFRTNAPGHEAQSPSTQVAAS